MHHRFLRPQALVEIESVFFESTGVERAEGSEFVGPMGFAKIVEAGPRKIADDVVVRGDEAPERGGAQRGGDV